MNWQDSPGNIRNQIGKCLFDISMNIEQRDVPGTLNFVRHLRSLAYPVLKRKEGALEEIKAAMNIHEEASYNEAFEAAMTAQELILDTLSEFNLYAFQETTIGDATGLALED